MTQLTFNLPQRYLVPFKLKRVPHYFTDVLVIGGGIAGTRAALALDPDLEAVVVTKETFPLSNSSWAQGGIAGVLDPLDEVASHVADTMSAGKGLCDEEIVRLVVEESPDRIRELIEYGALFDRIEGELALTREGGHSHRRIAHALGDATGKEIMRALLERVRQTDRQQFWEQTFIIDLLTDEGRCKGALVWNPQHGKTLVWAKQTILATGGAGYLYRETTNPEIATADGHAVGFRAGAELRDMEFMQFHPTVLYLAGISRHLISEAVRGEGAYLRDVNGIRFMPDVHELAELAPRDDVSRAITDRMESTRHQCVYLDLSHMKKELVHRRFPHIGKVCSEFGLDITSDPIPVRPGAHYMLGGLTTDQHGQTTLPGLWAAGEVTSTGLHGANRLASNSLLEGLVFGRRAGVKASEAASGQADQLSPRNLEPDWSEVATQSSELNIADLRNSLQSLMGRNMGIRRDAEGLLSAARQIDFWSRSVKHREFTRPPGWELQNMLLVSRLMVVSATARKESRGTHYRSDYPEQIEPQHVTITKSGDGS